MCIRIKHQPAESKMVVDKAEGKTSTRNSNDLFTRYIHDIRNMKKLDKEMINNIRNMSNENQMDIIIVFNDTVETLKDLLD